MFTRILFPLATGLLLTWTAIRFTVHDHGAIGIGLGIGFPLLLMTIAGRSIGSHVTAPYRASQAVAEGRKAVAEVVSVRGTGEILNDYRIYQVSLIVQPHDLPAYRTTTKAPLDPITDAGRVVPGALIMVARLEADKGDVAILDEPAPAHAVAIDRARAGTWDDVARVRGIRATPAAGRRFPLAVVSFIVGTLIMSFLNRDLVDRSATSLLAGNGLPTFINTPGLAAEAIESVRADAGLETFYYVSVYETRIEFVALNPATGGYDEWDLHVDGHSYDGPALRTPGIWDEDTSLDEIAWEDLPAMYTETLNLCAETPPRHDHVPVISINTFTAWDNFEPEIRVTIQSDYNYCNVTFGPTGNLVEHTVSER